MFDNICEGHPLATSVATVIRLQAMNSGMSKNIVSKDEERDRPTIRWLNDNTIEITFPDRKGIQFSSDPLPGIQLKVVYPN